MMKLLWEPVEAGNNTIVQVNNVVEVDDGAVVKVKDDTCVVDDSLV
jgi:hypothetical protein